MALTIVVVDNEKDGEDAAAHLANFDAPYRVLFEFDQYLRARVKYEDLPAGVAEALEAARDRLRELADAENVSF